MSACPVLGICMFEKRDIFSPVCYFILAGGEISLGVISEAYHAYIPRIFFK